MLPCTLQLQRLKSVRGPSSPQLAAQKSFASHSSLTDTDDEDEEHQVTQRSHSISNAAVRAAQELTGPVSSKLHHILHFSSAVLAMAELVVCKFSQHVHVMYHTTKHMFWPSL